MEQVRMNINESNTYLLIHHFPYFISRSSDELGTKPNGAKALKKSVNQNILSPNKMKRLFCFMILIYCALFTAQFRTFYDFVYIIRGISLWQRRWRAGTSCIVVFNGDFPGIVTFYFGFITVWGW